MTRLFAFAVGLLLAWPAWADMYPDASNAVLPAAINKLTSGGINLTPVTVKPALQQSPGSMVLTGGGWGLQGWYGNRGGAAAQWLLGSVAAPITVGGSPVAIGLVQGITKEACDNNTSNTGCNSALLLQNMGTAASTMVTSALTAVAETQSTAGLSLGNAQAGNFVAVASASATTGAMGAYIQGIRKGNTGSVYGAEISAQNDTQFDCSPTTYNLIGRCVGIWLALRGPAAGPAKLLSSAIQVGQGNLYGVAREGITFNNASVETLTFNDQSSSFVSLNIGGSHSVAAIMTHPGAGRTVLGADASYVGPGAFHRAFQFYGDTGLQFGRHSADAFPSGLVFTKSRNVTVGSHTTVQSGDDVGSLSFAASDGTAYINNALIKSVVTGTVSTGIVPAYLSMLTMDQAGTLAERLRLGADGFLQISDNGFTVIDEGGSLLSLSAPRVIYVGDSLTAAPYNRYVTLTTYKGKKFSTQNIGVNGWKVTDWQTNAPTLLDPLYQYRSLVNIAMIWLGTNDIALSGATPATVWTNLQALALAEQRKGFKVCVGTSISRVGNDTNLATLNGLITAGWAGAGIDCLVNFGGNANLTPNGSNYSNLTYYSPDQIHLNGTGQALAGSIAQTALNAYIGALPTTPSAVEFNAPGNMTAAALATVGTIAGSVCRTAAGLFIYKAGANCF